MHTEDLTIAAGEHRLAATRVVPAGGAAPTVLTLHGLGVTATRHTTRYLLDELAGDGVGALCFEFSGNGDSTGVMTEATLRRRRGEALTVARHLAADRRPVLVGTSMGAHLAAWTVPDLRPRGLVLFCPAAYPADAVDQPFDGTLARPGRYADSPAYAGIGEFDGDLLVVAARDDAVVPADVVDGYLAAAGRARSREVVWIDDCDHFIHRRLPGRPADRDRVLTAVRRVVSADHATV